MTPSRIALITGANRGLGAATARALAAQGTDIVFTWRSNEQEAFDMVAELEAFGRTAVALQLDITDTDAFPAFADRVTRELADRFGRETFDILVNNAGEAAVTPFGRVEADAMDRMYRIHVKGPVLLTQTLAPLLVDGGRILNLTTGLTRFVGGDYLAYASMKGAIEVATRYLAQALGSRGIAVNSLAPGATATDFAGGVIRDNDQYRAGITSVTAMQRVGEPDDVGRVAASVLAPEAGWLTGQRIEASGGAHL